MKTRVITVICAAALGFAGFAVSAEDVSKPVTQEKKPGFAVKAADAIFVRPVSLVSVAAGSVVFVLSLPVTAIRKEVKPSAHELVVSPVHKTFKRPLGDMDAMAD